MADFASPPEPEALAPQRFLGVFKYSHRALQLVWATSGPLTVGLASLTILGGLLPAGVAWVGRHLVDAVVAAQGTGALRAPLGWVAAEAGLVASLAVVQRGIGVSQSLLRAQLSQKVNALILEKALTLSLSQFEDSEFYDKLTRARQEASSRPLSLINRTFGLAQNALSLASFGALLIGFSPLAVAVLVLAGLPAFIAEARFSGDAFRLFRWRAPETRMQLYLESVLGREDHAKEVKLFQIGPVLLDRYRGIFRKLYQEDRDLTLRRGAWGAGLGLVGTAALYGAAAWTVAATVTGRLSLGEMTMIVLLFKQGQAAVSASLTAIGGMYEDNLYLSNLYEYLEQPVPERPGGATAGPLPGDGVRFEDVAFTYPGASKPTLHGISLHLRPGRSLALVGENGAGKTTLIKLLTRLYSPTGGRILLDGLDLEGWDLATLQRRVGVIFQDFARYQLPVGENVGVGDVDHLLDAARQAEAARKGMAAPFIEEMPKGYATQLGRWFKDGRELSGGQWQKIALSRAFMRTGADLLVLDEPTAAMDAEAEATVFEHFRGLTGDRMAILISHRFSTVRMADHIAVLSDGRITEEGTHEALMARAGTYARLFSLQAAGYQ